MATGDQAIRPRLTRERILAAAVEVADGQGLDGLSMRKLATAVGFEVMSLYNHISSKHDLLEGMLELVAAEIRLPEPSAAGWKAELRALAVDQHALLLRHRWAGPIWLAYFPGPARKAVMEMMLELLALGGVEPDLRDVGYHAITLHIGGFTSQELAYAAQEARAQELAGRASAEFPEDTFPRMAQHLRYHLEHDAAAGDELDGFGFVLDLILDGLERRTHAR